MTIKQKMLVLSLMALSAVLLTGLIQIFSLRSTMLEDRRDLIRSQVETAQSVVKAIAEEAKAAGVPLETAQANAKAVLRTMRFNGNDYFLAIDASPANQGLILAHPSASVEGKNLWNSKDPAGNLFVQGEIEAGRKGGGFSEFLFPRLNETVAAPKLAYTMNYDPWQWAITSALYIDDISAAFYSELFTMLMWMVPLILAIAAGTFVLSNSITLPLEAITSVTRLLADGNMTVTIPGTGRKDEIGHMAEATEIFRDTMIRARDLAQSQAAEQTQREARALHIEELTRSFDASAAALLQAVTQSASGMEGSARNMARIAEGTNSSATAVASAAQQAAANVQTVASATEELSSSISEIASQVSRSSQIAMQAVDEARRTDGQIQGLANAANKIGEVVDLIRAIAEQTNLLALNATIEAARAGEAGRGFAVVAAEVKELASQTSKATEEITTQISAIQSETRVAVDAVQSIGKTVEEMNHIAAAISASVEEQGAATSEIARNVEQASRGTQDVTDNILEVSHAASETRGAATSVEQAAAAVTRDALALRTEVESFLSGVRAA